MALLGSTLFPGTSLFSSPVQQLPRTWQTHQHISRTCGTASSNDSNLVAEKAVATTTERVRFGFRNLVETFWVDVERAEGKPLNVGLNAPITIASSRIEKLQNLAIRVELSNGCVGWGEVAVVPSVAGNQAMASVKVKEACQFLRQSSTMTLNLIFDEIGRILPGVELASGRAGVEMALIDAIANSIDVPLWRIFGGLSNTLSTAITLSVASPLEAFELASKLLLRGFNTFKLSMGRNLNTEIEVFQAIRAAHPHCLFIVDGNEGFTSKQAVEVLAKLHDLGLLPVVFEQPVKINDWKGLGDVSRIARDTYGISVAADESCRTLVDIQKIIKENLADVVNIRLSKSGVLGALEIVNLARKSGLNLIINSTVETRLATGFAGHLAAGIGCFKYVHLDAPFLLSEDPVVGGYEVSEAVYKFMNTRGQGGFLNWDVDS